MRLAWLACSACGFAPAAVPGGSADGHAPQDVATLQLDAHADAPANAQPVTLDFAVVADTTMDPTNMTSSAFGTSTYLIVDGNPKGGSLFRIALDAIPTGHVVTAAEFHVWTTTDTGAQVDLHHVLEAWDETATYLSRSTATPWTDANCAPPGSSDATILGSFTPAQMDTEYVTALPVALVQGWVDAPATNFGITIQSNNDDGARLASREATAGRRPFLRVTYFP